MGMYKHLVSALMDRGCLEALMLYDSPRREEGCLFRQSFIACRGLLRSFLQVNVLHNSGDLYGWEALVKVSSRFADFKSTLERYR